jgi:protein SCO1
MPTQLSSCVQTRENKTVRFYDDLIRGKIVLINFMYTKCEGVCPRQTANLVQVQKALGDHIGRDVLMYSITLKPQQDTPEGLREYAIGHGVKPGWLFLTGKPNDIETLRGKLDFVDSNPVRDRDKSKHIGVVLYGNEALDRWAACPALLTHHVAPNQFAVDGTHLQLFEDGIPFAAPRPVQGTSVRLPAWRTRT